MSKPRVFLSYSNQDRQFASAVAQELRSSGIFAYDPETEIKPGHEWRKSIMKGIKDADTVVVLVTQPHVAASSWIGYEVGSASAMGKDVLVVKPSTFSAGDLPRDLSGYRVLDFEPSSPGGLAKALVSRLAPAA